MTEVTGEVRVTVLDVWDTLRLPLVATDTAADLKRAALLAARVPRDPDEYLVKFRGVMVQDESQSLHAIGIPDGGAVIVLPHRRRPLW